MFRRGTRTRWRRCLPLAKNITSASAAITRSWIGIHPSQTGKQAFGEHPVYNPTSFRSPEDKVAYVAYMKAQLKELITQYHPGLIWFDGQWMKGWTKEDGRDLLSYLYELDPKLIVNDRAQRRGEITGTPEQTIPANGHR